MQGIIYSKRVFLRSVCDQKREVMQNAMILYNYTLILLFVCSLYRRTAQSLWHWIAPCLGTLCSFLSFTQWDWLKEQKWWPLPLYSFSARPTHQRNCSPTISFWPVCTNTHSCSCLLLNTLSLARNLSAQLEWSGCANILLFVNYWMLHVFHFQFKQH